MFVNIVGVLLLISVGVTNIPQVVKMLKTRNTSGMSLTMHAAFALSWALWLTYALHIGDWVLVASNSLGVVVEFSITVLIVVYRFTHHENIWGTFVNEGANLWFIIALLPVFTLSFINLEVMIVLLAVADTFIIIPQVIEVFKVKDLSGFSLASWWLFVGEACLCIWYAVSIGEPLSYAWAYLYLPCYVIIIWKIMQYRRSVNVS